VPWHEADHLTLSFVPDGTNVAGVPSALFRTLDSQQPTADWQQELLRAFQSWAAVADVNFALVPDGGQPLGTPGPDQGDPRFGDIRIAAVPMSPEVLAVSVPHDPFLSGTWSGDILMNDAAPSLGQANTLFPVVLHEVGHVLGLDDSSDPASVMFPRLHDQTTLSPSDIAAIQALYGPRVVDPLLGLVDNGTLPTATPMPGPTGYDGVTPLLFYANLTSNEDIDFYTLTVPDGYTGPLTIRLQTAGVSLLEPHLTVLDVAGQVVSDLSSTALGGDTLQAHLPDVRAGETYAVEVRGATNGLFGLGEYVVAANFDARSTVGPDALDTLARQSYSYLTANDIRAIFFDPVGALFHVDAHSNDTFATAENLAPAGIYGSEAPDRITASLSDPTDVDVYHIETPDESQPNGGNSGRPLVMTVTVRATQVNGIMPSVAVFDEDHDPLPALVLAHGDGTFTIQVTDVQPNSDYFVRVVADPTSGKVVGNYDLDVEYGHTIAAPATFLVGSVDGYGTPQSYSLVVKQAQLFDLLLTATAPSAPPGTALLMVLTDAEGRVVAERTATPGETTGGDPVLLPPGVYQASFVDASGASPSTAMSFRLYGASLTDPIGPALDNTTLRPMAIAMVGDSPSASLPFLGSNDAPYYWLALSLGSRDVRAPEEALSFAVTAAGPLQAPIGALATAGIPNPSGLSGTHDEVLGIMPTPAVGGIPSLPGRLPTQSADMTVSIGVPLFVSGIPMQVSPAEQGGEGPGTIGGVARVGSRLTAPETPVAARTPTLSSSSAAHDGPPTHLAPSDRLTVPPEPYVRREDAGVGFDLPQAIVVLVTAALVYSRLHSGRAGDRIGLPVRPACAGHTLMWRRVSRPFSFCRI
jgi:hypothetical protein